MTAPATRPSPRKTVRTGHRGEARSGSRRPTGRSGTRRSWRAWLRRDWPLLAMAAPMFVVVWLFWWVPTFGNVIAFQDYNPFTGSIFTSRVIGFTHFRDLFGDAQFYRAVINTLSITAFQLVFYFPVPIALALLLHSILSDRLRAFVQGVVYLPYFFSWVLVIAIFQQMFGGAGLINQTLRGHGYEGLDIMTNGQTFILLITSQVVWKEAGFGAIIFLAALSAINPQLYESAAVDGASRWRRLWHITLPGLRPVIILLLILRLGDALNVGFEQFFLQRSAVGAHHSEVFDTFVYYSGIRVGAFDYGAAGGLIKGVVGLILILAANKVAHTMGERGVYSRA